MHEKYKKYKTSENLKRKYKMCTRITHEKCIRNTV